MSDRLDNLYSHHEGEDGLDEGMAEGAMEESMDDDAPASETSE